MFCEGLTALVAKLGLLTVLPVAAPVAGPLAAALVVPALLAIGIAGMRHPSQEHCYEPYLNYRRKKEPPKKNPSPGIVAAKPNAVRLPLEDIITNLVDSESSVCKNALNELMSWKVDTAINAIPSVGGLLDASLRSSACTCTGWFGFEAPLSVPELVSLALDDSDKGVQIAAVSALTLSAPDGESVFLAAKAAIDVRNLERLNALPLARSPESCLHKPLLEKASKIQSGSPPGFLRLTPKEITTYVYGRCPHQGESERELAERWHNSRYKNIRNWMHDGRIRSIQIKKGLYDVQREQLDVLARIHTPQAVTPPATLENPN